MRAAAARSGGDGRVYRRRGFTLPAATDRTLFTREAVVLIHQRSLGIPRMISVICDNALVSGFAAGQKPVTQISCAKCAAISTWNRVGCLRAVRWRVCGAWHVARPTRPR